MRRFAISKTPSPILNNPDFRGVFGGADGKTLAKDAIGLVRAVEMIALPGSCFAVHEQIDDNIVRVSSDDYPAQAKPLYMDCRFLELTDSKPKARNNAMPPADVIIERLYQAVSSRYIWGGNRRRGVPQMLQYYPPCSQDADTEYWMLKGVDCSGLLYEATDGMTPRNTSMLIDYGAVVDIENLSIREIISKARPLDYIVWPGHIVFFIDTDKIIQSRHNPLNRYRHYPDGVYIEDAAIVLEELCGRKKPCNLYPDKTAGGSFVMRRFF